MDFERSPERIVKCLRLLNNFLQSSISVFLKLNFEKLMWNVLNNNPIDFLMQLIKTITN